MAQPLVSILTPSLNQARYLPSCLESVAAQSYPQIEHVVWDGGSTDGSLEILHSAGPSVTWVSEPDDGQSDALNSAFALSSGSIIGWVNSDDGYADRRAVQWAVEHFETHADTDVVFGHALLVNEENLVMQVRAVPPFFSRKVFRAVHYLTQPTLFFRRAALERLDTFLREDLHFVMDRDLIFRLSETSRFEQLPRVLAFDRHQRERKVLQPEIVAERGAFHAALEPAPFGARAISGAVRAWARIGGARTAARLPHMIDPAVEFRFPRTVTRLAWQIVVPRDRLPFGDA